MADSTVSFRPGEDRLAKIEAWASEHRLKRHAAILALLDAGLEADVAPAPKPIPRAAIKEANIMRRRAAAPLDTSSVGLLDREARRKEALARYSGEKGKKK